MPPIDFGGRQVEPPDNPKGVAKPTDSSKDASQLPEPPIQFEPQVLALLIIRGLQLGEWQVAQDLMRMQDTGMIVTPRWWQHTLCANCGHCWNYGGITPIIGVGECCIMFNTNLSNSYRVQQSFMHMSTKLSDEFADHLQYALAKLPFR